MILWRDAHDTYGDDAIEIVKQDGNHVWYKILDNKNPNSGDIHDCPRNSLDPAFYEISKGEYVKNVLKGKI